MNSLCEECKGKCCKGQIRVHSHEDFNENLLEDIGEEYMVLKVDKNNTCVCLVDGKCSIYDKRPIECQLFEVHSKCCIEFFDGIKTEHRCDPCYITEKAAIFTETKALKVEHYNCKDNLEKVITECLESDDWTMFVNGKKLRVYFINKDLSRIITTRLGSIKTVSQDLIHKIEKRVMGG